MLGKIIGALAGARAARGRGGVDEPSGALLGMAAVAVTRRFGLPGILAAAAGSYALKRYAARKAANPSAPRVR